MIDQVINWIDSLSTMERFFIVYFGLLFILWLWKNGGFKNKGSRFSFFRSQPKYELAVNKKDFVYEVVRWGLQNIAYEGTCQKRKRVNVEISYYPHKKIHGVFYSFQNMIRIYVNNHPGIDELINTILHEVVHNLQLISDKRNFEKKYAKLLAENTYEHHPMEIEAVKIAAAYTSACKNFMIKEGKLRVQQ